MAEIEFRGVSKTYGDGSPAIANLNLTVRDGEFLVLVGPSGCGKSTALRMIAGLEEISGGELMIGDVRANDLAPRDRDIAMIFQSYALYPHLTVEGNIGFGLKVRGMSAEAIRAKVRDTARLLELEELLHRKPGQLSGGQRQRVAMGRAIVRQPQAFLMDEPLSNLDARLRAQMRADVARLQKASGITTVYVTHDQVEAMTMGDRVAVMNGGELLQLDTPRAIYDRPEDLFVASFIGSPPMNFFRARLASDGTAIPDLSGNIVAGIRPEALRLVPADTAADFIGTIEFVEDLGATLLAHVNIPGLALVHGTADTQGGGAEIRELRLRVALDTSDPRRAADPISLGLDQDRLHLFNADTGKRIATDAM